MPWMVSDADSWETIGVSLLCSIVTLVLSAVISVKVTTKVLAERTHNHGKLIGDLGDTCGRLMETIEKFEKRLDNANRDLTQRIEAGEKELLRCQRACLDMFVQKEEYVREVGKQVAFENRLNSHIDTALRDFRDQVDRVHGRITEIAKGLAHLEGVTDGSGH